MFSIRKKHKVQVVYKNDRLGTGDVVTELTEHPKKKDIVSVLQWKISGTFNDIYTIPDLTNIEEIMSFLEQYISIPEAAEYKYSMMSDCCLAYQIAWKYLKDENYYIPKQLEKMPETIKDIRWIIATGSKYTNPADKIAFCSILKETISVLKLIRWGIGTIDRKDRKIDPRDKKFIKSILTLFNNSNFHYDGEKNIRFSPENTEMLGSIMINGKKISISWGFRVKTLWSILEKMASQEKYEVPEVMQDLHAMRIEVKTPEDALHIASYLFANAFHSWIPKMELKWNMIWESVKSNFIANGFSADNPRFIIALQGLISKWWKEISADRNELRLICSKPSLEIQIVLVNNKNESGYAHHDIYRMGRKIKAKIRRHGWISLTGINIIVENVLAQNTAQSSSHVSIGIPKEKIIKYLLDGWWLITFRGTNKNRKFTTQEVIDKHKRNFPDSTIFTSSQSNL
jgi:Region found in RelA / SpoT proteins